jgi:hypothetical protein
MGEPFNIPYSSIFGNLEKTQGVTIANDTTGAAVASTFAAAAGGNVPALLALDPGAEGVIDNEKAAEKFKEGVGDTLDTLRGAASLVANMPKYLLVGGLVVGGALLVAGVIYLVGKHRKKAS